LSNTKSWILGYPWLILAHQYSKSQVPVINNKYLRMRWSTLQRQTRKLLFRNGPNHSIEGIA